MTNKSDKELTTELIQSGSDIASAAVGATIGLIGTPVAAVGGAVAGVAIARTLKKVGSELKRRFLGPKEEKRIGATFAFAGQIISAGLSAGKKLRSDGFFDINTNVNTPADEIFEGILLKARDSYEERKLQLLGILFANIAFHEEISPAYANQLVNIAGQLTYRQFVALSIAEEQNSEGPIVQEIDFRANETAKQNLGLNGISLMTEIYELCQRGYVSAANGSAWISLVDVNPGDMRAQGTGSVLAQMMGLNTIPESDRQEFYDIFPKSVTLSI